MPTPKTLTETDVLAISEGVGDPTWLRDHRQTAFKAFSDLDWPVVRDEDWRFTNPRRIPLDAQILTSAREGVEPLTTGITATAGDLQGGVRLVDGGVGAANPAITRDLPEGVVVTDLVTAVSQHPDLVQKYLGTAVGTDEVFAAFAAAAWTSGAFVHVPADTELAAPIAITIQAATPGTHVQWVLIVAERHAKVTVLLDQAVVAGTDDPSMVTSTVINVVEAVVGEGARVNLVTAQDWDDSVAHVTTHRGRVGRDGNYQHSEITLGGQTVYVRPDVWLDGKGSSAEMLGVYLPTGTEKFEHRSLIFHDADHSSSDYIHKGALSDDAHATWYGNIRIDPSARQTVSDETNRNLILSPGARADTLPFLEIETADVASCGHHSSVGQVDAVQLWYLQSRGISRDDAARMLVFAFFAEVLERIDAPGVADTILADIEEAIRQAPVTTMDQRRTMSAQGDGTMSAQGDGAMSAQGDDSVGAQVA